MRENLSSFSTFLFSMFKHCPFYKLNWNLGTERRHFKKENWKKSWGNKDLGEQEKIILKSLIPRRAAVLKMCFIDSVSRLKKQHSSNVQNVFFDGQARWRDNNFSSF